MVNLPWLDKEVATMTSTKPQAPPGRKVEGPHNIYEGFVEKPTTVQSTQSAFPQAPPGRNPKGSHDIYANSTVNKNTTEDNKVNWSQNDDYESDNINQTPWKSPTDAEKVDDYVGKNYTTTWTGPDDSFIYDPSKNPYHFEENEEDGFIDIASLPFDDDKTYGDIADEQDGLINWWHEEKD